MILEIEAKKLRNFEAASLFDVSPTFISDLLANREDIINICESNSICKKRKVMKRTSHLEKVEDAAVTWIDEMNHNPSGNAVTRSSVKLMANLITKELLHTPETSFLPSYWTICTSQVLPKL